MSGLLLCSSKRGRIPFVITENKTEIWSLEELCYYLYQNACRVTEEFFSQELTEYLREELGLTALADRLLALKKNEADFFEYILAVCDAANYYTKEERLLLVQRLREFDGMSRAGRLKYLADFSLTQRLYAQAVREYEAILALKYKENYDRDFEGRICHNMGVAYAKMLLYKEAEECFLRASSLTEEPCIRKNLLLLYYLAGDTVRYEQTAQAFTEEERQELLEKWEKVGHVEPETERSEAVIEKWKQEYRAEMR